MRKHSGAKPRETFDIEPVNSVLPATVWGQFPGAHWIVAGLTDVARRQTTQASMAVLVAKPRLIGLGFVFGDGGFDVQDPESALYTILSKQHGDDANAAFNAIRQELVSFANAFDHALCCETASR